MSVQLCGHGSGVCVWHVEIEYMKHISLAVWIEDDTGPVCTVIWRLECQWIESRTVCFKIIHCWLCLFALVYNGLDFSPGAMIWRLEQIG